MIKKFKSLSPEKKCLSIILGFSLIILIVLIPVSLSVNLWGLTIGWCIGFVTSITNTIMLFKSAKVISNAAKSEKGLGISVVFYLIRFLLAAAVITICIVMQYKVKNTYFTWSFCTCAAAILPSALILAIFYHDTDNGKTKS